MANIYRWTNTRAGRGRLAQLGVLAVFFMFAGATAAMRGRLDLIASPSIMVTAVVMGGILAYVIRASQRRLSTFEIVLGDDEIVRRLAGHDDLKILRSDVTAIHELPNGLFVRGAQTEAQMLVPREVDRFDELRAELATWKALTTAPVDRRAAYASVALSMAGLCCYGVAFFAREAMVVVPATLLAVVHSFYSIAKMRSAAHIQVGARKLLIVSTTLIAISMLWRAWTFL